MVHSNSYILKATLLGKEGKLATMKTAILWVTLMLIIILGASAIAGIQELWSVSYSTTRLSGRAMCYNPATGHLLFANTVESTIFVYDTTGQYVKTMNNGGFPYTGAQFPYDLDVTADGVIYALHYAQGSVYRWENEDATPTVALGIGTTNVRAMKVVGTGANTVIFTTFVTGTCRVFVPTSVSDYTTFQYYETFGDGSVGLWAVAASGDTAVATVYAIQPVGNPWQFASFTKSGGSWSKNLNFKGTYRRYATMMEICPTNSDLYMLQYYASSDAGFAISTMRRDRVLVRLDGTTGVQKEVYELATTLPQAYISNNTDISFDTTNHIIYWMCNMGVSTTVPSGNLLLGAVKYSDDPSTMKVYQIPAITVDGSTTDWPAYVMETAIEWSCYPNNTTYLGPTDYTGRIKTAWNSKQNRFYIFAELTDDVTVSLDTWSSVWNAEDLAGFYFNANNIYANSYGVNSIQQLIIKLNGMSRNAVFSTGGPASYSNYTITGVQFAIDSTSVPGKRCFEISVPIYTSLDSTGTGITHTLIPNEYLGFDAEFVDQDGPPNSSTTYKWYAYSQAQSKLGVGHRIGTVMVKGVVLTPSADTTLGNSSTIQFTQVGGKLPITWHSSDTTVCTIDSTGLCTALVSTGTAYITAIDADGMTSLPVKIDTVVPVILSEFKFD
ncbi:MAG: Ig-like domain-containing protein [bacterium]